MPSNRKWIGALLALAMAGFATSCTEEDDTGGTGNNPPPAGGETALFLLIDEDCIDNGSAPNNFSATAVNDHIAGVGLRQPLTYFLENIGQVITLYTGAVGDEGVFVPATIPAGWISAGPTTNGTRNYLVPGPGLGGGGDETLLDQIPQVTPLRATGLAMLEGTRVLAVVYDGDISVNYSPLQGNLMGANLGMAAFEILSVTQRTDGSDADLPKMEVRILSVSQTEALNLVLFENAPVPQSSSEPMDVAPPANPPAAQFADAP